MLETEFEFEIYRTALSPLATREYSSTSAFTAVIAPKSACSSWSVHPHMTHV